LVDYRTWTTAAILDKLAWKSINDEVYEDNLKYKAVYSKSKTYQNELHLAEKKKSAFKTIKCCVEKFSQKRLTNEYSVLIG